MNEHTLTYLDGWQSHETGVSGDENPFSERTQPASHQAWMSGWCARFSAIKHGGDLSLDNEY